jgi:hypothetical protein
MKPRLPKDRTPADAIGMITKRLADHPVSCRDRNASPGPLHERKRPATTTSSEPSGSEPSTRLKVIDPADEGQMKELLERGWRRV